MGHCFLALFTKNKELLKKVLKKITKNKPKMNSIAARVKIKKLKEISDKSSLIKPKKTDNMYNVAHINSANINKFNKFVLLNKNKKKETQNIKFQNSILYCILIIFYNSIISFLRTLTFKSKKL